MSDGPPRLRHKSKQNPTSEGTASEAAPGFMTWALDGKQPTPETDFAKAGSRALLGLERIQSLREAYGLGK